MTKLGTVNLNRLVVFSAVAENGSLTAAARQLGIAKTMVSAHMQRLEAELGVSLLTRTTRKVALTEAGQQFYATSRLALRDIDHAVMQATHGANIPSGTLRVTAPVDYGAAVVTPMLVLLQQRYPLLRVELMCADRVVDLVSEGIDLAIRLGGLKDSTHRAVTFWNYTKWLVASPDFLARHGVAPKKLADLESVPFVAMSELARPAFFDFSGPKGQKQSIRFNESFSVNTAPACRAAVLAGAGLAVLTDFAVSEDVAAGRLVRVLPQWATAKSGIHAVFPAARYMPSKIRVFIDELKALGSDDLA